MEQIDDKYLLNILGFLCKGGGCIAYTDDDNIFKLFSEANRRGLTHNLSINKAFSIQDRRRGEKKESSFSKAYVYWTDKIKRK